jgi:hypothetical protein
MPPFLLVLLKNRFAQIAIAVVLAFSVGAGIAALKVNSYYTKKIALEEAVWESKVEAAASHAKAVDLVVVTEYKYKTLRIKDKKDATDKEIEAASPTLAEQDRVCPLGPDFVRLYNAATRPVPDAGRGSDEATTKGTAKP